MTSSSKGSKSSNAGGEAAGGRVVRMWYDRVRTPTKIEGESLTRQSFKDAVNINNIMARFLGGGEITHLNHNAPNYGVSPSIDFREALETVQKSEESFAKLPAEIRKKFGQDPVEFLQFVENPENAAEMAALGLLEPEAAERILTSRGGEKPPTAQGEASNNDSPPPPAVD